MLPDFPILAYRGNFRCEAGIDFGGAILGAEFGGGLREDEVIFPPLREWGLTYSALIRTVNLPDTEPPVDRLSYVWNFYVQSKSNGNEPFLMRCPRDDKFYLCFFPDDDLQLSLIDRRLSTTGLKIQQVYVRGVVPDNDDGSFDEEGS